VLLLVGEAEHYAIDGELKRLKRDGADVQSVVERLDQQGGLGDGVATGRGLGIGSEHGDEV